MILIAKKSRINLIFILLLIVILIGSIIFVNAIPYDFGISPINDIENLIDQAPNSLIVKKCPKDFEGYKEEYEINEPEFKTLFMACYIPSLEESIQEKIKKGELIAIPEELKGSHTEVPEDYPSIKLDKNRKFYPKEKTINFLKANKDKIKWIKSAKQWKNKLTKTMPTKGTTAYYIKQHKLSVIKRLKKMDIL